MCNNNNSNNSILQKIYNNKINNNNITQKRKIKKERKGNWYHLCVWDNNILSQLICWASEGPCKWQ